MAQRPRNPPIAGLRRLLLALFIVGIAVVVAVLILGRDDDPLLDRREPGESVVAPPEEFTLVGEGFEFTQSEGNRPIFHIRGESVKVRRGNVVLLEDVALTLYDDEGEAYRVEAKEASYDQSSQDATLSGDLRMTGPDSMVLLADGMRLANEGKQAQTVGPVELFWGDALHATAQRFVARLAIDVFALAGEVEISQLTPEGAGAPAVLRAASVTFHRRIHNIRADKNVVLTRGADRLQADLLSLFLSTDDRRLEVLRARGEVRGRFVNTTEAGAPERRALDVGGQTASAKAVRVTGEILTVHMDSAGKDPAQIELTRGRGPQAELVAETFDGVDNILRADFVVSSALPEGGQHVEALGSPVLTETPTGEIETVLRQITSETLWARLDPRGDLDTVEAGGGVDYSSADLTAQGERLEYSASEGKAELFGEPVRLVSDRGELTAPHVVQEWATGGETGGDAAGGVTSDLIWADGGTRSVLRSEQASGLGSSPFARGDGPLRIESQEAYWRDGTALFRGGARAWQGDSLLLASELRARQTPGGGEALQAKGPVRSVWVPEPADDGSASEGEPQVPIEVTAREMSYDKPAGDAKGTLVYRGQVRSVQDELSLRCGQLTVELDEQGDAESLGCREAVRLEDGATGQSARGELALYDLSGRTIEITGAPVVLTHGDGGQVEGSRAVYDLDQGRARVVGGDDAGGDVPDAPAAAEQTAGAETAQEGRQ